MAFDVPKASDRVWHAGLLHKLKSYGISGQIFGLISSFLSNRQLSVVLDDVICDLPDGLVCDIDIYADDTTLYSKCDQASNLWQQLELASEFESDLQDTVD